MARDSSQGSDGDRPASLFGPDSRSPSIELPKGGGAIRGSGEKFAANAVTGAGSMGSVASTVPGHMSGAEKRRSHGQGQLAECCCQAERL